MNGVATVAGHVAEKMAPHVKKHGAKLVPESLKKGKDGQASNLDGAKFVAASSLHGTAGGSESILPHRRLCLIYDVNILSLLQSFKYMFALSFQVSLRSGPAWKLEQSSLGKV